MLLWKWGFQYYWTKILIQQQTVFVDPMLYIMDEFLFDIDTQRIFIFERRLRFFNEFKNEFIKVEVYGKYTSGRY